MSNAVPIPKKARQLCIYCQQNEADTRDHVPGKSLFPKPRPTNLISVPACESCNKGFHLDDDYFRLLSMAEMVGDNSSAQVVRTITRGSLDRPEAAKFLLELRSKTEIAEVTTAEGIFTGEKARLLNFDRARIRRIIKRYVRGLFYEETGRPLPLEVEFEAHFIGELEMDPLIYKEASEKLLFQIDKIPMKQIGDTFSYSTKLFDEDSIASLWKLQFFGGLVFYSWTYTKPSKDD